jgi:hypothetical protein
MQDIQEMLKRNINFWCPKSNENTCTGFSKRTEVGVSIYKVGGELSTRGTNQVGESLRGVFFPSLVGWGYGKF